MRRLKNTLFMALILMAMNIQAQKVDIDNFSILVEYCELPAHKIPQEDRTYTMDVSGTYKFDKAEIADALNLRGWDLVEENGKASVKLRLSDFVQGKAVSSKRVSENKDKDGKVTSRTTYYKYTSTNTGKANMVIYGPSNPYKKPSKKERPEKKKKKTKAELKKEAEQKEKEANPFLQGVEVDEEEEENSAERVAYYDLTENYTVTSNESTSLKAAFDDYTRRANQEYAQQKEKYMQNVIGRANWGLNETYGYQKRGIRAKFKRLDSKKHPEYEMYNNATEAMKEIFKQKKFNRPFDDVKENIEPILTYFQSVANKYSSSDKQDKKLKAASLYNIAQINYYLDRPEKTLEVGNQLVRWGYEQKDGERFVKKANELKDLLAFHEVSGRYFSTQENADEITSDGESDEGED